MIGSETPIKYPCPKCDFGVTLPAPLYAHAAKVHHASEGVMECFKTYVQNIDRDLPASEGIDWLQAEVIRTVAQVAIDEQEAAGVVVKVPEVKENPPAARSGLTPADLTCVHCPDRGPFKSPLGLIGHKKMHAPKNSLRDDRK